MDQFKQLAAFVAVALKGSLSAAARSEGVTPAVIGRRLDALEERLGVKLLFRTTRGVSLTFEGTAFLEDCQRVLNDLSNAEASVSLGGIKASGHLRISAPAGFGRRHVAPLVAKFLETHPEVSVSLDLNDRLVDLVHEGLDLAIRVGELADSNLVSVKLSENRRVVVASPEYLRRYGTPRIPQDLSAHNCLNLVSGGQVRDWGFLVDGETLTLKLGGTLECNDGAVLREWVLAGLGVTWRSMWEVGEDIRLGRLISVLDDFAPPPTGVYALYPQRKHLPLRVRLLVDHLKSAYSNAAYWEAA